ncbi:hypothetical protein AgCh_015582 [Apium graveolens]
MEPADSEHSSSLKIWDYSDSESAPASSWSTIPNRPLPVDIGRCTCVIVKEKYVEGLHGGSLYTVYTNFTVVILCNQPFRCCLGAFRITCTLSQSLKRLVFDSLMDYLKRVMEDNRKLAVARHKRHNGRSEFIVAQSIKGILGPGDDSFVGSVTSNLIGSKYNIWDQPHAVSELNEKSFWKMFDTGLYEQCMRKYGAIL